MVLMAGQTELRETMASLFEAELKEAGFGQYIHWLLPGLFSRFRHRSPTELETAALLEEFDNGTYEDYGWEDALEAIDPQSGEREKIETWLKGFFSVCLASVLSTAYAHSMLLETCTSPAQPAKYPYSHHQIDCDPRRSPLSPGDSHSRTQSSL